MKEPQLTKESFMKIMQGFQPTAVVFAALDLGVFPKLEDKEMDAAEAARALKCGRRGVEPLLNALVPLGLLRKKGEKFSLAPFARKHLVPGKEGYIGNMAYHSGHIMRAWVQLPECVRTGRPAPRPPADSPEAKKRHRHFILAMDDNASRYADMLVASLDMRGVRRVLDVGGGPGTYAFAFARHSPDVRAAIFDLPPTCAIARERIMALGYQSQVGTIEGDFNRDSLGTGFDLVLMSSILHIYSPSQNRRLIRKGYSALNPGGKLVVMELELDSTRTKPQSGAMFSINMLVNTETGSAYPSDEIKTWLVQAGFEKTKKISLDGRICALVAHKPGAAKKKSGPKK